MTRPWLAGRASRLAALLAGGAHAVSIAEPWGGQPSWWLQLLALAVLAWLVQRADSWRQAGALGWIFATAWLTGTFWWLFISMHTYGGLPAPLAMLAVVALAAFLASYYAAACAIFAALKGRSRAASAVIFASAWLFAELLRVTLFTGFPWGEGGYAHVDGPLSFMASTIGVHGITLVAALLAFVLSLLATARAPGTWRYWAVFAAAAGLLAACNMAAAPAVEPDSRPRLTVTLLQGNIPQDEKFQGGTGIPLALDWYGRELRQASSDIVVAPETALPLLPHQLPEGYFEALRARFAKGGQAALIGIPLGGFDRGYTNSVIGFRPGGEFYHYDKHHLVPFGEFVPPLFKWFTRMMNIPLGDFDRGALAQPSFAWKGERFAPNICYEDLFGEELALQFADAATAPTVLVNVSNIAWFGNTVAIDQHLQISRMRSLELRRPMVRATNTGATAIIDHRGRVAHQLARHTRGVLTGQVEGRSAITGYAWWASRVGLLPLWLISILPLLGGAALRMARGRELARPR